MTSVPSKTKKSLSTRLFGRFYTHEFIGRLLVKQVASQILIGDVKVIKVIEPFCGDGRLISWFLEAINTIGGSQKVTWHFELWDNDSQALEQAERLLKLKSKELNQKIKIDIFQGDSFQRAPKYYSKFDVCITNPPWETLKPDTREIKHLAPAKAASYIQALREQDDFLSKTFPLSKPTKKFSGWGTNLSRCGAEAALNLVTKDGVCGIVLPSSILSDQSSEKLREFLFTRFSVSQVGFFAAEAKLFDKVDQPSIIIVAKQGSHTKKAPKISSYRKDLKESLTKLSKIEWDTISSQTYRLPVHFGLELTAITNKLLNFPKFSDLEGPTHGDLWAGREIDETGHQDFLSVKAAGSIPFIKGRMIERFAITQTPDKYVSRDRVAKLPLSLNFSRLAWRDVARPNQKRRVHATIIPPGWIAGNSLHVAYFKDDNQEKLKVLLAIVNSLTFEAQVRQFLGTGHISLGAVRQARIPNVFNGPLSIQIVSLVDRLLSKASSSQAELEVIIAKLYNLTKEEFELILSSFEKLTEDEREELLNPKLWDSKVVSCTLEAAKSKEQIANHYAPRLSQLDLDIAHSVPPGGNWKDIPESVPSERIANIRSSYARGEGSRSTYYGRLRPDAPSYTINTYFARPGNGCHLHYDYSGGQHRTISQREAARLQSFPDSFKFLGSNSEINTQIGNAVPPLLAFQVAKSFPIKKGMYVDLFSGAGGLGLGFHWAGWKSIIANDLEGTFLKTHSHNMPGSTIQGDIRDKKIFDELLEKAQEARKANPNVPLFVVGGPPCQGFSTAGNRRTMTDERNWLFVQYKAFLQKLKPDGFVFENVSGLLSMEKGKIFELISSELRKCTKQLHCWILKTEEFAIPQRRTRVLLIGDSTGVMSGREPKKLTRLESDQRTLFDDLASAITVAEALSDLPKLKAGEDGCHLPYLTEPQNIYQKLMRGMITPEQYLVDVVRRLSRMAA